jgi:hypothetical protein
MYITPSGKEVLVRVELLADVPLCISPHYLHSIELKEGISSLLFCAILR